MRIWLENWYRRGLLPTFSIIHTREDTSDNQERSGGRRTALELEALTEGTTGRQSRSRIGMTSASDPPVPRSKPGRDCRLRFFLRSCLPHSCFCLGFQATLSEAYRAGYPPRLAGWCTPQVCRDDAQPFSSGRKEAVKKTSAAQFLQPRRPALCAAGQSSRDSGEFKGKDVHCTRRRRASPYTASNLG